MYTPETPARERRLWAKWELRAHASRFPPSSQGPLELPCFLGATEQPRCVVLGCFSGDAAARLSSNLIRVKNKLTASFQSEVVRDSFLLTFNRRGSKVDQSTFWGEGSHLTLNSCG